MAFGMEVGLGPGDCVFDGDPAAPRTGGTPTTTQFLARVYCGQTAAWMKTPLGTEVDLGPGHIVLDGVPALRETGTTAPPIFSAGVYCGHGRPSQLLLSSCLIIGRTRQIQVNCERSPDVESFNVRWRHAAFRTSQLSLSVSNVADCSPKRKGTGTLDHGERGSACL